MITNVAVTSTSYYSELQKVTLTYSGEADDVVTFQVNVTSASTSLNTQTYIDLVPVYLSITETNNISFSGRFTRQTIDYLVINGSATNVTLAPIVPIQQPYPRVVVPCYVNGSIVSEEDFTNITTSLTSQFNTSIRSFYNLTMPVDTPVTLYYRGDVVSVVNTTQNVLMASIPRNVIIFTNTNTNVTIGSDTYNCSANTNCSI